MKKRIQISELLNPITAEKYQPELLAYFEKGGTWQELLGYSSHVMEAQYKVAYDFYKGGDFAKAGSAFSYLTVLNPYKYAYWIGVAISKQAEGSLEEAVVAYTVAEAIEPDNPFPLLHLSQCYYSLHQKEYAIEYLQKTIEVAEKNPEFQEYRQKARAILKQLK